MPTGPTPAGAACAVLWLSGMDRSHLLLGTWIVSSFGYYKKDAMNTHGEYFHEHMLSFSLGKYLGVGHFSETAKPFPK